jgi:lipopolysaccharide transport system ATP-binding protein
VSAAAVTVEDIAKRYRIGAQREAYGTLRDAIASSARRGYARLLGRADAAAPPEIWALRQVSVEVAQGQVLGIIGPNGGGKTTLLKILSRVTRPTAGRAWVHGRVGSLLEVGTGFHPELTGRENIYLNGAILGMNRSEIKRKFDEIVAFAEVEQFLDTPVKRYSSGMYMRLAFAVAAHLEPDILIVDEVLAVGDAAFQRKSLGQMENVARAGRTVLFVSHNLVAVQALCDKVIWLHKGEVLLEGAPGEVVGRYLQSSTSSATEQTWPDPAGAPGNEHIRIHRVSVRPTDGTASDPITMRTPVVIEFSFWNMAEGAYLDPYVQLITEQGVVAFESSPGPGSGWYGRAYPVGLFQNECRIPGDLLIAGHYRVMVSVVRDDHHALFELHDAAVIDVQDVAELRDSWYGEMVGVVRPHLTWSTELVGGPPVKN